MSTFPDKPFKNFPNRPVRQSTDEEIKAYVLEQRPREFSYEGYVHFGFDQDLTKAHRLVLCQNENVLEVWAIDGKDIEREIRSLLCFFKRSESKATIIGTYKENHFHGFTLDNDMVSPISRFG
jgi:hypothetical protein